MKCTVCKEKDAITKDGRNLCLKCLRREIRRETPIPGIYSRARSTEKRENIHETKYGMD